MVNITWMPQALKDLDTISEYIEKDSEYYAKITVQKIFSAVKQLELFPKIGRIVPEKQDPTLREILYRNYRIVYKLSENEIYILTIFHGSYQGGIGHL
ncbi:MAG: type II toxin-antitoxin system RelE/ParE family toxin [Promethearchaeota archaeon]